MKLIEGTLRALKFNMQFYFDRIRISFCVIVLQIDSIYLLEIKHWLKICVTNKNQGNKLKDSESFG